MKNILIHLHLPLICMGEKYTNPEYILLTNYLLKTLINRSYCIMFFKIIDRDPIMRFFIWLYWVNNSHFQKCKKSNSFVNFLLSHTVFFFLSFFLNTAVFFSYSKSAQLITSSSATLNIWRKFWTSQKLV